MSTEKKVLATVVALAVGRVVACRPPGRLQNQTLETQLTIMILTLV